ncbi:hypothetical protein O181_090382 [Austropuccinia psidii MF-1]|uniref:Uncharacterized protein n=1 Tax=Austropuccinia psidii MF-1 TaxID=1389203 RepID=A0A9Q3IVF4_9BASI|nr:hypothetical protein [Austropuccinia psidii MF-1]
MQDSFKYAKERWDRTHKPPDFKVGEFVLVSTLNFYNIKGPNILKDSLAGPFLIKTLLQCNAVQLELTGELINISLTFPVSLIKRYSSSDKDLFPLRNKPTLGIPPLEEGKERNIVKVLKQRRTRNKRKREYLVRYRTQLKKMNFYFRKI